MGRPRIPDEQKKREGSELRSFFEKAQKLEPGLSQDSIASELDITQGLFGQWLNGYTNIPDKRLLWLGKRLSFDPVKIRPTLAQYSHEVSGDRRRLEFISVFDELSPAAQEELLRHAALLRAAYNKD